MATVERSSPALRFRSAEGDPQRRKSVGRIGPWQLVRLLSEGSLTRTYLATPAQGATTTPAYVLKLLRKEWWRDSQAIEMQRREAWIGRRLTHPHVASILSAQVDQPPFYIVTPLLAGETAAEMLATGSLPSLPLALWIARQVAEALDALHRTLGMIHADVKPANILVSPDGHTTLLDFGCAQSASEARSCASRPVVGTLHYVAPEMITSACAVEPRCDIYSLGVTLYELLTGELPFDAPEPAQLVAMHRSAKPACIRSRRPELPKPVASLVHRMLAKEPLRRPASAMEVVEQLMRLEIDSFAAR